MQGEAQALTRQGEAKTLAGHAEEATGEAHHVGEGATIVSRELCRLKTSF